MGLDSSHVDGNNQSTKTIYEFNGYFFQMFHLLQKQRWTSKIVKRLNHERSLSIHQAKTTTPSTRAYRVIVMWECQLEKSERKQTDIQGYANNLNLISRPNSRDAFFGWMYQLHYRRSKPGEDVRYVDCTSLYPTSPGKLFYRLALCKALPPSPRRQPASSSPTILLFRQKTTRMNPSRIQ